MVHYRALFTELLGDDDVAAAAAPVSPPVGRSRPARELPAHDLSDRELAYLDDDSIADRVEPVDQRRHDGQRDGQLGDSHERARVQAIVDHQEQRGDRADAPYDDHVAGPQAGHPASHDAGYDPAAEDVAAVQGADGDRGDAGDADRRTREGGLLAGDRDQQPQVLHVRRERLDDDRDLPRT